MKGDHAEKRYMYRRENSNHSYQLSNKAIAKSLEWVWACIIILIDFSYSKYEEMGRRQMLFFKPTRPYQETNLKIEGIKNPFHASHL
jgi:hypothetical protein